MRNASLTTFDTRGGFEFLNVRQGPFRYVFSLADKKNNKWLCIVWCRGKVGPVLVCATNANAMNSPLRFLE